MGDNTCTLTFKQTELRSELESLASLESDTDLSGSSGPRRSRDCHVNIIKSLPQSKGTLLLFNGAQTLHRVTPVLPDSNIDSNLNQETSSTSTSTQDPILATCTPPDHDHRGSSRAPSARDFKHDFKHDSNDSESSSRSSVRSEAITVDSVSSTSSNSSNPSNSSRMVAVFAFNPEPGQKNSKEVRLKVYGRTGETLDA